MDDIQREIDKLISLGFTRDQAIVYLLERGEKDAAEQERNRAAIKTYWSESLGAFVTVPED